ncbi:MAG: hypothetical protein M1821_002386 [Bathelium mastoideum]|nr:MAG: hypothetical protein M1821_002386 [Bathelium mastoideum]KAI9686404.1 MAG: hypothetical protein M1822_003749 [Bathelium mastoideum]
MQRVGSVLWPSLQALQIYGANTDVGKTIVSTILCRAFKDKKKFKVSYIKPVSTGSIDDADGPHISRFTDSVITKTLVQFSKPVSPHLAAREDGNVIPDSIILQKTVEALNERAAQEDDLVIVETAGGVLSPAPSGNSQADVYRPLRLPVVLVGDYHLGGISSTISAYESLRVRGYDVVSHLIFEDDEYQNAQYLSDYFQKREIRTTGLPRPPDQSSDRDTDLEAMKSYYQEVASSASVEQVLESLTAMHLQRIARLAEMQDKAQQNVWHPFTQHHGRKAEDILVIDSAYNDFFDTKALTSPSSHNSLLQPALDASSSWWTQGLGHGNPQLSLAAAYAAGRYGHVMFAGTIHEPALKLTELLLEHHKNPRLAKVYFTDSGSTGMEVAVKMALRASATRYDWNHKTDQIEILGLKGSYHGDTMGVMDCSEPSTFNEKVEWYNPKGYWFDFPRIVMKDGKWQSVPPAELAGELGDTQTFDSLDGVFDLQARDASKYAEYIASTLETLRDQGRKFGGLIIEPVVLGAGGMLFADPLFQHTLVQVIRDNPDLISANPHKSASGGAESWSGLPIVFDEVFTGIYRLGQFNCNGFVQAEPDVVVNAKLLTGGLIPLCTTVASQEIFEAFLSNDKTDALLHGHSYTAHALGCNVAVESLRISSNKELQGDWDKFSSSWKSPTSSSQGRVAPWSMWSKDFITQLSHKQSVEDVFALGCVLSISIRDPSGRGYTSTAAQALQRDLLSMGASSGWLIHSRVLGNVIYFMTSLSVAEDTVARTEDILLDKLK